MVLERDVFKIDAAVRHFLNGVFRRGEGDLLIEHLADAHGAGQGTGQEQKDVGEHHQGIHHLQHIAQKAGQLAHLQRSGKDHVAAEPHDEHHAGVHADLESGQVEGGVVEGLLRGLHQAGVDHLKLLFLILAAHEGFDGANGSEPFLHDVVERVHGALQDAVHGRDFMQDQSQRQSKDGGADEKHHRQLRIHGKGEADAHQQHHGAAHQRAQAAVDGVLQNGHVRGHAGDERGGGKVVDIGKGVLLHAGKFRLAYARAPAVGGAGSETRVEQAAYQRKNGAYAHLSALI